MGIKATLFRNRRNHGSLHHSVTHGRKGTTLTFPRSYHSTHQLAAIKPVNYKTSSSYSHRKYAIYDTTTLKLIDVYDNFSRKSLKYSDVKYITPRKVFTDTDLIKFRKTFSRKDLVKLPNNVNDPIIEPPVAPGGTTNNVTRIGNKSPEEPLRSRQTTFTRALQEFTKRSVLKITSAGPQIANLMESANQVKDSTKLMYNYTWDVSIITRAYNQHTRRQIPEPGLNQLITTTHFPSANMLYSTSNKSYNNILSRFNSIFPYVKTRDKLSNLDDTMSQCNGSNCTLGHTQSTEHAEFTIKPTGHDLNRNSNNTFRGRTNGSTKSTNYYYILGMKRNYSSDSTFTGPSTVFNIAEGNQISNPLPSHPKNTNIRVPGYSMADDTELLDNNNYDKSTQILAGEELRVLQHAYMPYFYMQHNIVPSFGLTYLQRGR